MNHRFILSTESTADLPPDMLRVRDISVLPYSYSIGTEVFTDDMGQAPGARRSFYRLLRKGAMPSTSQVNEYQYTCYFEKLLQQGDVLHLAFSSGLSGSCNNARLAAEALRKKYPEMKLVVIDSLAASVGHGLLTLLAADWRDAGDSIEETAVRVDENRLRVHHQFLVGDLSWLHRSGRVSGAAAKVGTVLNVCPLLRMNDQGKIIAWQKAHGQKNAAKKLLEAMEVHAEGGRAYSGRCIICHTDDPSNAESLRLQVEDRFPALAGSVIICETGPVIASHTGPGLLGVVFTGDIRSGQPT